ncbi:MAG: hypothetical protein NTZ05_13195 [Chloroflexi bacterium]|nr:hypothetical protein [Chloroflexota bacterium]
MTDRPLRDISTDAQRALVASNVPPMLYVRGGKLVRVRSDEAGRPFIEQTDDAAVRGALTRSANYMRIGEHGPRHISPPDDVVRQVMSEGTWHGLPPLEGLVEMPVLRPDGTVLDAPGYDHPTRLVYVPSKGLVVPPVPSMPTQEDIRQAVALMDEAIGDFPFVDAASKANALGLFLTQVLRPAIAGQVPLALLDKPQGGTGASLLAELVAILAGQPAAMLGAPKEEDVWKDRILGRSEAATLPQRATWLATGNNIRLRRNMARRSLPDPHGRQAAPPVAEDGVPAS